MSKQNNSESNNLCVPLETFENYQVVYMYEDDNVSENTPAHSSIADQNAKKNTSCETDVEISSTVDDQTVNSEPKSRKDTKKSSRLITESKGFSRKGAKSSEKNKITGKSGIKKRKNKKSKEIPQYENSCNSSKNILPKKYHFKEMPEKPPNNKSEEGQDIRDSHVSTTQETSECLEDNSMAEINKKTPENIILTKKVQSRRGRPKKQLFCDNVSMPSNANDQIIESSTEQISKKKKRGRPKKKLNVHEQTTLQNTVIETKATSECTVAEEKSQQFTPLEKEHVLEENEGSTILSPEILKTDLSVTSKAKKVRNPQKRKNSKTKTNPEESCSLFQQEFSASTANKSEIENENSIESGFKDDFKETKENLNTNESAPNNMDNVVKEKPDEDESDDICLSKLKETLEGSDKNDNSVIEEEKSNLCDTEIKQYCKANEHPTKRNSKMPIMSDFEYNIDSIVTDLPSHENSEPVKSVVDDEQPTTSFVAESSSGRPIRRKGKKVLHYDEGSDEDPFANVELSDDDGDPRRSKKGKRYFSDDEYVPGKKRGRVSTPETTDSDIDKKEEDIKKIGRKKSNSKSPKKRGKKSNLEQSNYLVEDDGRVRPGSSIIKIDDDNVDPSDEFENFIAKKIQGTNIKIKRVSNVEPRAITPLEIPVMDQISNKTVETSTQTNIYKTKNTSVQTIDSYDVPMKTNVVLSTEQAENACAFLKDIVKTTSELGELMTQKSNDFIQKKINTKHVTDTFKMDYCVQKSFLLFKLAKHNLMQMEEDLSKQYENFLTQNDMMQYREQPKSIIATSTALDSDSDCEIIEESVDNALKTKNKPTFNLKTVFLNKELSIKIAKKPSEEQKVKDKINIKGKNPVWISNSVLVKKVKPTQSFLAQDSRNKKPPDTYVTYEMVSKFFKDYYRQNASSICAPFISTDWQNFKKDPICCNYFHIEPIQFSTYVNSSNFQETDLTNSINITVPASDVINEHANSTITNRNSTPKTLFLLCFKAIQIEMNKHNFERNVLNITASNSEILNEKSNTKIHGRIINPKTLFSLSVQAVLKGISKNNLDKCQLLHPTLKTNNTSKINGIKKYPKTLFSLCVQSVQEEMNKSNCEKSLHNITDINKLSTKTLFELSFNNIKNIMNKGNTCQDFIYKLNVTSITQIVPLLKTPTIGVLYDVCQNTNVKKDRTNNPKSLISFCLETIQLHLETLNKCYKNQYNKSDVMNNRIPKSLKHITYASLIEHYFLTKSKTSSNIDEELNKVFESSQNTVLPIRAKFMENSENQKVTQSENVTDMAICNTKLCSIKTLYEICLKTVLLMLNKSQGDKIECNIQINSVNTVPEEIFVNLQNDSSDSEYENTYFDNEENNFYADETYENNYDADCYQEECNVESKPDFHSLTSDPPCTPIHGNIGNEYDFLEINKIRNMSKNLPDLAMVKIEPIENDFTYDEANTFIKDEPADDLEETSYMPQIENVIAKKEKFIDEFATEQKLFSQSSLRVRRHFEPDSDSEADNTMSLLIPQTYETFDIDKLKNAESSILHEKDINKKNTFSNKKQDKRKANTRSSIKKGINTAKEGQDGNDSKDSSPDSESDATENFIKKVTVKHKDRKKAKEMALVNELASFARQEDKDEIKEAENKESTSDSDSSATKNFNLRSRRITRKDRRKRVQEAVIKCKDKNNAEEMSLVDKLPVFAKQDEKDGLRIEKNEESTSDSESSATKNFNLRSRKNIGKDNSQEPVIKSRNKNNAKDISLLKELGLFAAQDKVNDISEEDSKNNSCDLNPDTTKKINLRSQRKTRKDLVKEPVMRPKDRNLAKEMALVNELALFAGQEGEVKIREDDCKNCSSDSDSDASSNQNAKDHRNSKKGVAKEPSIKNKPLPEDEIQCNNVDSTQQISENVENSTKSYCDDTSHSNLNKNGLLAYNDYVNNLYSKLKDSNVYTDLGNTSVNFANTSVSFDNYDEWDRSYSPIIQCDEPAELIQCEPTFPPFDNIDGNHTDLEHSAEKNKTECDSLNENITKNTELSHEESLEWKCYPIDVKDTKLYQKAIVVLDKLPETLVETYFKFQNISNKSNDDIKVESSTKSFDEPQSEVKSEDTCATTESDEAMNCNLDIAVPYINESIRAIPPSNSTDELGGIKENIIINSEIKVEVKDEVFDKPIKKEAVAENTVHKNYSRTKNHIKTETVTNLNMDAENKNRDQLMLTADKMMNKELQLLHSQPEFNDDLTQTVPQKSTKTSQKACKKTVNKEDVTMEDNSSSEEEKQWVNTKEKLLKKLEKKQDNSSVEEAKSAKIVSEFLEKRDGSEKRKRNLVKRSTRSRRSILEQQKQLSVLSKELFGEESGESCPAGKKGSHSFGKGRRNIRKVIDKKSLARSTLIANVEELERKKRLLACRTKWKEQLGSEDVLVVNGEVCLEYDFEENQPAVSIHSYFTSIMKAHQYDGVKFMWDACFESLQMIEAGYPGGGCILAHCMGLGKTLQVLALLHTVMTHPRVRMQRILVCCPLSTVLNWVDEIHKWIGPVTDSIKVFELSKLKKTYERAYQLEDWYNGGGIFIIGYELFRNLTTLDPILDKIRPTIVNKIRTALLDPGPDMIICDEGHLLKNDSSILAVAMSRVATKRRIVLTGTPMQNNLREYYCMVNFVKPNLLGRYSEYSNRFENPIMNGQHRDSQEEDIKLMKQRTHILHKVLEGCLQRQEASVLYPYLPKKHEYTVFIPLTKCQSDLYKHYLKNYTRKAKQSVLRDFHTLQKIWTHPHVLHHFQMKMSDKNVDVKAEKLEDDLAHEELTASVDVKPATTEVWWLQYLEGGDMLQSLESSNKLLAVFRILEECTALDDKVLIFSTSLCTMDTLEYFLKRINGWSLGKEYYRLDGSVPAEVRQKWCREFNAPTNHTTKLFLISTRAGCLGLNMTAANRVIILDTSWNPAHDVQSIFRVYRFGQKKDCYIYRLVALGTMEQKIYERAVTKQAVACRVIDEQQIDRHYNMEELTELYKFDESGSGVAAGVALGVTDVALLRVACDAPLHAVHEHDSLLRGSAEQQLPEHERVAAWQQFEMEQTDKQMKNFGKQSNKTSSKKPHGHDYALSPTKAPDFNKSVDNGNTKKERKRSSKDQIKLEGEPSTSQEIISHNDNIHIPTVNKIKEILSHHYSESNGKTFDIASLVKNVQNLIFSGAKSGSEPMDALAENVAKVLLESTNVNSQPHVESSNTESQNEIDVTDNERRRKKNRVKKKRKMKKEHEAQTHNEDDISHSTKKKRKAAIRAKEKLDSIESEMNKDDDDWTVEENYSILSLKIKKDKRKSDQKHLDSATEQKRIVINIGNGGTSETRQENIEGAEQTTPQKEHSNTDDISILVSDDDDDVIINANEPEKRKNTKNVKKKGNNKETQKEGTENNDKNEDLNQEEPIPLHPSLLKNPNFIKIVAHTYMAGNDLLEDDAAFLAAKYSTQSALQEIQEGKVICSGPLYDIAVNVVGKTILKKLQTSVNTNKVVESPKKSVEQSSSEPSISQVNADNVKSSKEGNESKTDKNVTQRKESVSSKRTPERQNSSDSDDLVLVESKIDEPKCSPAKRTREKNSRKDSTSTTKEPNERKTEVSDASLPKTASASTSIVPNVESGGRHGSHASTSSAVDDDDDVRVIEEAPATNKPEYNAPNLKRRNSQPLAVNCVTSAAKAREVPVLKSSQTSKKKKSVDAAHEPSHIIPDIDLDDSSSSGLDSTEQKSTKSPPIIKASQKSKIKTPIKRQAAEEQYIIPDIDLDEHSTENKEQTQTKNLAMKPTMATRNIKVKSPQALRGSKPETLVKAQTVETVIIPDIDLDDGLNENSEQIEVMKPKRTYVKSTTAGTIQTVESNKPTKEQNKIASVKTQHKESSLIIPDIVIDDDSPEHSENEPITAENTPGLSTAVAQTDKQAADPEKMLSKVQSAEAPLIISNIDLDDDSTEEKTYSKVAQSSKSNVPTKPVTTVVEPPFIIPDICLDDDSNEHSGEAESNATSNPSIESSQKITNPAMSPIITENIVEQTQHTEVTMKTTKKSSGSHTICLDSDDEEPIMINEKVVHSVQEINKTPPTPAVSAANISHTQAASASTQNPGPSSQQEPSNPTSTETESPKSKPADTTTYDLDDDVSFIEHVDVDSIMQAKATTATNPLKRPNKIGEVLRFPKRLLPSSNSSPKVGSQPGKGTFKIVKVIGSKAGGGEKVTNKTVTKSDKDPLRILKDVVQIKASHFDKPTPQTKPATDNAISPQSKSTTETSLKQKSVKAQVTNPNLNIAKPNILNRKVMSSSSIDLTNVGAGPSRDYPKKTVPSLSNKTTKGEMRLVFPKSGTKSIPVTIMGSAKDIVIGPKINKTPSKPSTIDSTFKSAKKKFAIKLDNSNIQAGNSKKRSTTSTDTGTVKKTKPESYRQLTLKDFNIDDFEDIIELE